MSGPSASGSKATRGGRFRRIARVAWAVVSWYVVESFVFGLAVMPAALFWVWHLRRGIRPEWLHALVLAMSLVPAYLIFAVALMALSALAARGLGWRTPADAEMPIADLDGALLRWVRYSATTHLVRVLAGGLLRSTPLWTLFLRWNGARVGRNVYVNSLSLMDHNLIELGDDVVVGSDVHLSGHTVEAGVVRTARVRVGAGATIGNGSVIGIGVVVGEGAQVGALSVVPKRRVIEARGIYVGTQLRQIRGRAAAPDEGDT